MNDGTQQPDGPPQPQDPALVVQVLLQQMQNRFEQMSSSIIGRIDEMGERIDQLEKSIDTLMKQTGVSDKPGSTPP